MDFPKIDVRQIPVIISWVAGLLLLGLILSGCKPYEECSVPVNAKDPIVLIPCGPDTVSLPGSAVSERDDKTTSPAPGEVTDSDPNDEPVYDGGTRPGRPGEEPTGTVGDPTKYI